MTVPIRIWLVCVTLFGTGCSLFLADETNYLREAQGRATQDEVRRKLGTPYLEALTKDEAVWVYQVRAVETASNNSWSATGSWCDEYVLIFDQRGILLRWTHASQHHRGMLWPVYCIHDGFEFTSFASYQTRY